MRRTLLRLAPSSLTNTRVQTRSPAASKRSGWNNDPTADIQPGHHVISVCNQYDIAFPDKMRRLRGFKLYENPYALSVFTCRQHCVAHHSMRYFDKLEHPLAKSLLDIYIEKKKEPLWIACLAHGAGAFPSKVATRKIVHALRDALAAAGYDRFGRRVLADGESSAIAELHGTLRVLSSSPTAVCNAKFVDLLKYAKKIIASVEIDLRRGAHFEVTQNRGDQSSRHVQGLQRQQHQQRQPKHGAWQNQSRGPNNQRGRRAN